MNKKIIVASFLVFIFLVVLAIFFFKKSGRSNNPPFILKNFIDVSKIEKISKFRSCQGHTVVPVDESESKRNMKHYILLKPEFIGKQIPVYAPYDSQVGIFSRPEMGLEGEIWFDSGSEWQFSIEHINILENLKDRDKVKAGELVGYVPKNGIDIVYAIGAKTVKEIDGYMSPFAKLDSPFLHMAKDVLSEFEKYGISGTQELIYSKEFRDENPCQYRDSQGGLNDIDHPEDWVFLK